MALYRQNAKISALSSGKLDKYEYLTGEGLGYKPDALQKAKFEYSPLGQVSHKGLNGDEKEEGLLKILKNIEDKTDKDYQLGVKSIGYAIGEKLSQEAKINKSLLIIRNLIFKEVKMSTVILQILSL